MKKTVALLLLMPSMCLAAPTVSNVSGTIQNGQSITITCNGAGTKSPVAPLIWADFSTNASPSDLGQLSSFGTVENMAWDADEGYNNTGGMKGTVGNGVWTMFVPTNGDAFNKAGAHTYTYHHEKQNFIVSGTGQNYKTFRIWPPSGSVSNLYFSSSHGRIFVENIGTESGYFKNCNPNTTNWFTKERFIVASSAPGVKDGTTEERFNGVTKHSGTIISRSASAPNDWTKIVTVHGVLANKSSWSPAWSSSNDFWADDVYVDRTFQRVMIGDASTLATSRKLGICVPTAWSNTSITCTLAIPTNDFPAGTTNYLYVVDDTNTPNSAGKQIVIGGSAAGDAAPTVTSVVPSTGAYQGTTIATATGTGFLPGATVTVGTVSASGVSVLSATQVQFTIPANIPGTSGYDLIVTNIDGQFGVLPSTIGYTSAASNQPPFNVNGGDDWALTLPAAALLAGAAEDDGLPSGTLSYQWAKKSGPGSVTFGSSTSKTTTASFSTAGTYVVTLTVSDGSLSTVSPDVTIIVSNAIGIAFPFKSR